MTPMKDIVPQHEIGLSAWVVIHHRGILPRIVHGLRIAPEHRRITLCGTDGPIISFAPHDAADFARCLLLGGISVDAKRVCLNMRIDLWDGVMPVPSYYAAFGVAGTAMAIEMASSPCYLPNWDPTGAGRTIILADGLATADQLARQIVAAKPSRVRSALIEAA